MDGLNLGVAETLLDAVSAPVASSARSIPTRATIITWQTICGTEPDAVSFELQGSLDGVNFGPIDTSTEVAGEVKTVEFAGNFIKAELKSNTNGDDFSVIVTAKNVNQRSEVSTNIIGGKIGLGSGFIDFNIDPIFLNSISSLRQLAETITDKSHTTFSDYLSLQIAPDANSLIAAGRETLLYTPATNTKTISQLYLDEAFYYGYSDQAIGTVFGRHTSLLQFGAGNVTSLIGHLMNGENDGSGTMTRYRGISMTSGNWGEGSIGTVEYIRIFKPGGASITTIKGILIDDLTFTGATGHAIDCNSNFKVGLDGKDVVMIPVTSDPGIAGAIWNNSGTLAISAGA